MDNAGELREAIESELRELERACGGIERALMTRKWDELSTAIADSRRITHALQNAMEAAEAVRDKEFDETIFRRLRYVQAIRNNQMSRLQQYHDEVGKRLQLMAQWRAALRSVGRKPRSVSRLATLDRFS